MPAYPVYALMVEFMAYTGLRASEVAGLEVGDLTFAPGLCCSVNVRRTKERRSGTWVTGKVEAVAPYRAATALASGADGRLPSRAPAR